MASGGSRVTEKVGAHAFAAAQTQLSRQWRQRSTAPAMDALVESVGVRALPSEEGSSACPSPRARSRRTSCAGSQGGSGAGGAELEVLDVVCSAPQAQVVESTTALLVWSPPTVTLRGGGDAPVPSLQIHRFEVDWVGAWGGGAALACLPACLALPDVRTRTASQTQLSDPCERISESDWRPLPSGDVDVHEVKVRARGAWGRMQLARAAAWPCSAPLPKHAATRAQAGPPAWAPAAPLGPANTRPAPPLSAHAPPLAAQVAGLRPGHTYAVRVRPVPCWEDDLEQDWDICTQPSDPLVFTTIPSPPSQAKAPTLVQRERKALKVSTLRSQWRGRRVEGAGRKLTGGRGAWKGGGRAGGACC